MFAAVIHRRHAEEFHRLAETMSALGRLAVPTVHEFNSPLAGIQSAFMLARDAIPATQPHIRYVGDIKCQVQRISQLTRQSSIAQRQRRECMCRLRPSSAMRSPFSGS